ncbi:TPA: hypothetical protein UMT89_000356 [Stenotrophomonas maltophilia]|nr:hypothetical protein [Stenotrophomonas maltophilia]
MPSEIASLVDAKERIIRFWGHHKAVKDNVDEYAKVAYYLSSEGIFKEAFKKFSGDLWNVYRSLPPGQRNRFSSSIMKYASERHGFAAQHNVVMMGNVAGEAFLEYLQNGVLWKDAINIRHGEFSHSIQWLTLGCCKDPPNNLVELYKNTSLLSEPEMMTRRKHGTISAREYLWTWLVDCRLPDPSVGDDQEGIFSSAFRGPERTTRYVMSKLEPDLFVPYILAQRWKRRNWALVEGKDDNDEVVKEHALAKHTNGWSLDAKRTLATREANLTVKPAMKSDGNTISIKFHGVGGELFVRD